MSNEQTFFLRWNNHHNTLVQELDSLLLNAALVDCTIAAEGQCIQVHKVILCACSPYFQALLSQQCEKYPIVILSNIGFQELQSVIVYMYKGEVNVPQDRIPRFFKACEFLQIRGLADGAASNVISGVPSTSEETRDSNPSNQSSVLPAVSNCNDIPPTTSNSVVISSENRRSFSPSVHQERLSRRLTRSRVSRSFNCTNSSDLPRQTEISVIKDSIRTVHSNSSNIATNISYLIEETENEIPAVFIEPKTELITESFYGSAEDSTMGEYNGLLDSNNDDRSRDENYRFNDQQDSLSIAVNHQPNKCPKKRKTLKKKLQRTSKKTTKKMKPRKKYSTHPCPNKCGRSYKTISSMERHFTVECGKEASLPCPDCPNKFYYKRALDSHWIRYHRV